MRLPQDATYQRVSEAEKALAAIVGEALQRWSLIDVLVIHRVGRLLPSEQIVLVAVAA
ncbi:MAG TPA: molybdenum cofactor biosynthesis protein MoaE, partial [Accumulibacter sp.]|uniref:molybdenum cofactor biosynthesis protein MoaE n=1 Tax=Accumulibacter sp. TaxID=2053492 RepID=UPI002CAE7625